MRKQILIIGSLNMDMVIEMAKMPLAGETVLGRSLTYVPGGKGANQAYTVGKLGGKGVMLGSVGSDELGERLREKLEQSGTDTGYVASAADIPTGMAAIYVNDAGDNSIVVIPGANASCDTQFLKKNEELFRESDYVMFQMEIPYPAVFYGIRKAKELGKTVVLNPAPAPSPEEIPEDIWSKIDYLTPNETETAKLSNIPNGSEENIRKGARRLLEKGVKNVLITLGERGALLVNGREEKLYPARKTEAVDTTAAGDCFNGAFVVGLAEGMEVPDAVRFANLAASVTVERKGAQNSIPGREEVDRLWRQY